MAEEYKVKVIGEFTPDFDGLDKTIIEHMVTRSTKHWRHANLESTKQYIKDKWEQTLVAKYGHSMGELLRKAIYFDDYVEQLALQVLNGVRRHHAEDLVDCAKKTCSSEVQPDNPFFFTQIIEMQQPAINLRDTYKLGQGVYKQREEEENRKPVKEL